MEFFNKKEDVIEIKLTQYGKHLLSKGKFRPHSYAFFDDNILYDQQFAGRSGAEPQNAIEPRIQENTPSLKAQYVYTGIETEIVKLNKLVRSGKAELGDDILQPMGIRHFALSAPLGRSQLGNDQAPGIAMRYLHNEITGSEYYMTGSFPTMQIPQLTSNIIFETQIEYENDSATTPAEHDSAEAVSVVYDDGSFITVKDDYILLELKEFNTDNFKENFEIEVYLVEEEDVSGSVITPSLSATSKYKREKWIPLHFYKEKPTIVNDLLVDQELTVTSNLPTYTPDFVEYFFDIHVDHEIDRSILCEAITTIESDDYFGEPPYECPEANTSAFVTADSPYTTTTTSDDITDCAVEPVAGATSTTSGLTTNVDGTRATRNDLEGSE